MKKHLIIIVLLCALMLTSCGNPGAVQTSEPDHSTENPNQSESQFAPNSTAKPTGLSSEFLPLDVKEFGYSVSKKGYLYIAIIIHNPNVDCCVEFPSFRVTARDADGILLGSDDQVLSVIYPQQDFCYAGQMFAVEDIPATVDVEVLAPDDYNIVKPHQVDYSNYKPLTIVNSAIREDRVMGEIDNSNNFDIDSSIVAILYRDESGKLLGGDSTFVETVAASGNTPFDFSIRSGISADSYEIYANIW